MPEANMARLESELRGKTLLTYWHFLQQGDRPLGVREVQRALGFSSPSVAFHHLEKLHRLNLLNKSDTGEYTLVGEVKVGFIKLFVRVGRLMLPRYLFYAILVTTTLAAYVALYPQPLTVHNLMALIIGVLASGILWYETIRIMREAPF